ncbi:MAG: phage antirepressor KilAC domain-containing protein [Flavobacteriales bacterium]|nr:phage antirepressor KilAC domain-containing protein [Flavobacteriales bacterium]
MELIKITENNGEKAVSAKELYEFLGFDRSQWSRWYQKNIMQNDFAIEYSDYQTIDLVSNGNPTKDFALSLDFAKRLSMMARTEKGEHARKYFIECEKVAKNPLQNISRIDLAKMIIESEEENQRLQIELKENEPLVVFAKALQISEHNILIGELAKILKQNNIEIGQNRLFIWLRDHSYLIRSGEQYNLPTQKSLELGLFEVKTTTINNPDGSVRVTKTTKVTPKGQKYFINKFLKHNLKIV